MNVLQFSLFRLFAAITFLAIVCAALVDESKVLASLIYTTVVILLFSAPVGIVYRRGADRAFWIGFAIFGCTYFLLPKFYPPGESCEPHWFCLSPSSEACSPVISTRPSKRNTRLTTGSLRQLLLRLAQSIQLRCKLLAVHDPDALVPHQIEQSREPPKLPSVILYALHQQQLLESS